MAKEFNLIDDLINVSQIDFGFLREFKRSKINYATNNDAAISDAYRAGIYDAMINHVADQGVKITGTCQTKEEVEKNLHNISFNANLALTDNLNHSVQSIEDQKKLIEKWFSNNAPDFTHFILMTPKDKAKNKLTQIVPEFFKSSFYDVNYIFVEHTDTDIVHYHAMVQKKLDNEIINIIKLSFIGLCIKYQVNLF